METHAVKQRELRADLDIWANPVMEIVGAVLTPLSATLIGLGQAVMILRKVLLEMDSYIWRPPWFVYIVYMQELDRQFVVEREKRKPPW